MQTLLENPQSVTPKSAAVDNRLLAAKRYEIHFQILRILAPNVRAIVDALPAFFQEHIKKCRRPFIGQNAASLLNLRTILRPGSIIMNPAQGRPVDIRIFTQVISEHGFIPKRFKIVLHTDIINVCRYDEDRVPRGGANVFAAIAAYFQTIRHAGP